MNEDILMSGKDAERWSVIQRVNEGDWTEVQAATALGLSTRQVRRIVSRVRVERKAGVMHRSRGRVSHRRTADLEREAMVQAIRTRYVDFGPTLACEKLAEYEGIERSVSTVRRVMIDEGLWKAKHGRQRHRAWRERKACVGELIQVDGSEHDWFEDRDPKCHLITFVDDATGRVMEASFEEAEDTLTLMRLTKRYIRRYGRPLRLYPDRDSIYQTNREATIDEQLRDQQAETQYARAMRELEIDITCALSPQAKGRVERLFGTFQDRMVKELRLAGISTRDAGNRWLKKYLPKYNRRFAVEPRDATDCHRRVRRDQHLDEILVIRTPRTVRSDYTVGFQNRVFQLLKKQPVRVSPKLTVDMEQRLDGTIHVRYRDRYLNVKEITDKVKATRARTRPPTRAHENDLASTGTTGHFY
jgi:hypothetical protein